MFLRTLLTKHVSFPTCGKLLLLKSDFTIKKLEYHAFPTTFPLKFYSHEKRFILELTQIRLRLQTSVENIIHLVSNFLY